MHSYQALPSIKFTLIDETAPGLELLNGIGQGNQSTIERQLNGI